MSIEDHYKLLHERFVSNHTGTTPSEILIISTSVHLSILILSLSVSIFRFDVSSWKYFVGEFFVLTLPALLCLTCCSDREEQLLSVALAIILILLYLSHRWSSRIERKKPIWETELLMGSSVPFLTKYRANMLLITGICILAVDFPVFPRRFAKTESYGYGLMDVGVGSFVFAAGIVSIEARNITTLRTVWGCFKKSMEESLPMFLLGLARLLSVKVSGYHEHVSEYGVHWNFFFTLAATKLISSAILSTVPVDQTWLLSLLISLGHEAFLATDMGASFILDEQFSREDFITANREGLISLPGYIAIYFGGVYWGRQILLRLDKDKTFGGHFNLLKFLAPWTCIMWLSLFYSEALFLPPSRRMANFSYFNWMLAYNLTMLVLFLCVDMMVFGTRETILPNFENSFTSRPLKGGKGKGGSKLSKKLQLENAKRNEAARHPHPIILDSISYNALPYFLLCNIITGIINLNVKTIHMQYCPAILILIIYSFFCDVFVVYLWKKNIRWRA